MGHRLYVGNLAYETTDRDLGRLFEQYGRVRTAQVIMDQELGRSKGFGFVEMTSDLEARAAVVALNGKEAQGRFLTVREADSKACGTVRGPQKGPLGQGRKRPSPLGKRLRRIRPKPESTPPAS